MKAKTINRHYFFQLVFMTLLITSILLGILLYGNLVKHDEYLLQAISVSPTSFLELSSLLIPYALSFALPFGFILALLLCYGKWASSNEILALRSLGKGIFSWGIPGFLLSLVVSLFSLYTFLQWAPTSRAEFDQKKKAIVWSNINSLLETEKEIEFELGQDSASLTNQNLSTLSDEPIRKVSLSVGSKDEDNWYNLRILLLGEQGELLRIINSESARIEKNANGSQLFLLLKNVDLESSLDSEKKNLFVAFEEWNKPLVFNLSTNGSSINLKRLGFFKLLELSKKKNEKEGEAKVLIQKSLALGTSSFFLFLVLLPLSITKGRKESLSNLAMGIGLSVLYYTCLTLLEDFAVSYSNSFYLWIPNLVCFIIGSYLLYKFEHVNL
jgi:lipopolysaccharide export LptBFGC system permease protein LptF|tara:strand:+ start:1 stop:1152 length:1152 start_codon:yes stop_codon:yes gene_type:complete